MSYFDRECVIMALFVWDLENYMHLLHLSPLQWTVGFAAALFVGISKTGIPGVGIIVVPLLGIGFGSRLGAGVMLPMLIVGDMFAVAWYRQHAQWSKLVGLLPWVYAGVAIGTYALVKTGQSTSLKDPTDLIVGALVLVMVVLHLLKNKLGEKLQPTSPAGVAGTGVAAGFSTTISNAAGPVMQIYMAAHKLSKEAFMGTIAWYFFIVNLSKFPIYWIISRMIPQKPIVTVDSLKFNLMIAPAIILGVFIGKWLLPRISQKSFEWTVIVLAAIGGLKLMNAQVVVVNAWHWTTHLIR